MKDASTLFLAQDQDQSDRNRSECCTSRKNFPDLLFLSLLLFLILLLLLLSLMDGLISLSTLLLFPLLPLLHLLILFSTFLLQQRSSDLFIQATRSLVLKRSSLLHLLFRILSSSHVQSCFLDFLSSPRLILSNTTPKTSLLSSSLRFKPTLHLCLVNQRRFHLLISGHQTY